MWPWPGAMAWPGSATRPPRPPRSRRRSPWSFRSASPGPARPARRRRWRPSPGHALCASLVAPSWSCGPTPMSPPGERPAADLRPRLDRLGDRRRHRPGSPLRPRLAGGRRQRRRRRPAAAEGGSMSAAGLTIVGYPFLPTGMAEHARSMFRAFMSQGVTPRLLDVSPVNRGYDPDLERDFAPHLVTTLGEGVNLFGVNGDEAARVIEQLGEDTFVRGY